jgi:hypothetical protein
VRDTERILGLLDLDTAIRHIDLGMKDDDLPDNVFE